MEFGIPLERGQHLETVEFGHLDIQQDHVGRVASALFERGQSVDRFDDAIALLRQAASNHGSDDEGVVGDQHGRARSQLSCQCARVGDQDQPTTGMQRAGDKRALLPVRGWSDVGIVDAP